MKMPDQLDPRMAAICGMDCTVCYKHLLTKKYARRCHGCRYDDETLPEHCRACRIKDCARARGLEYCFQCQAYPCKWVKSLDKSYRRRYGASLVSNGLFMQEHGVSLFLEREQTRWACPRCNGVISLHDGICSECAAAAEPRPQESERAGGGPSSPEAGDQT